MSKVIKANNVEVQQERPPNRGMSLIDMVRSIVYWMLISLALVAVAGFFYVAYIEFYIIPNLLAQKVGDGASLLHVGFVVVLMIGSAVIASLLQRRGIFETHRELMSAHTNTVFAAIENLANGRWTSDSYTHRDAFKTGASLGYKVGHATTDANPEEVIGKLLNSNIPAQRQITGQSRDVVSDMDQYLDDLESRRNRLSS